MHRNPATWLWVAAPILAACAFLLASNGQAEGERVSRDDVLKIAAAFARGDAAGAKRQADPAIRNLMKKITLNEDPAFTAKFPGSRCARVVIKMKDGKSFEECPPYRKGDPEWQLTDAELNDKFSELTTPIIGVALVSAGVGDTILVHAREAIAVIGR